MAKIGINTATAKAIHKEYMRRVRTPLLESLDVEYQRAQETSASTTTIVSKKQALRDQPATVDALNITETSVVGVTTQLKACWDTNVLGTNPFFSFSNRLLKVFFPNPNFFAVSLNLSTPSFLATS